MKMAFFLRAGLKIVVHVYSRKLFLFRGADFLQNYPVAVGKPETPTPIGQYAIKNKVLNPGDILGTRWMGLTIPGGNYGLHGTDNPASIGTFASKGCIRMYNQDVEELFDMVPIGTPVFIENK